MLLHFTSLTDLFNQTPSQLLWEASSHMLQLMHKGCSYTYPPLSTARYSFIQLSELEQCRVKKLAQSFNTVAQDSNPGSLSQESEALPLSLCVLQRLMGRAVVEHNVIKHLSTSLFTSTTKTCVTGNNCILLKALLIYKSLYNVDMLAQSETKTSD